MRPIGDLMKELGFNADSPVETQKAFIRHLISKANGSGPFVPPAIQVVANSNNSDAQLSFDPEILGTQAAEPLLKKAARSR